MENKSTIFKIVSCTLLFAGFALVSCKDQQEEPVAPPKIRTLTLNVDHTPHEGLFDVAPNVTELNVEVECDSIWGVKMETQPWVTLSSDRDKNVFTVTFLETNLGSTPRQATIIVSSGKLSKQLVVNQRPLALTAAVTDSLVLVELYKALDGAYWVGDSKDVAWDLKKPISTWYGVTLKEIEGQQRVVTLFLSGLGLDGQLPAQIGLLSELQTLNLDGNELKGDIPTEIGELKNLKELRMDNNKFTGEIPKSIANLQKLERLNAVGNRLKVFPVEICALANLTYIDLHDNEISSLPGEVITMSSLEYLYLNNNKLTVLPKGLDQMPSLLYLHAQNNVIEALPEEIGKLTSLLSLNLKDNKILGTIPASITNLVGLKYLYMAGNTLTGEIPQGMEKMVALNVVELDGNSLTGQMPDFGLNTKLTRLRLSGNSLTGDISNYFGQCPGIQEIMLDGNQLSGSIPAALADSKKTPMLTYMALNDNNLTGTVPAGFAVQLDKWNPSFNAFGFLLNGNRLSGAIPEVMYSIAWGRAATKFKYATNLYPQQAGYILTNQK